MTENPSSAKKIPELTEEERLAAETPSPADTERDSAVEEARQLSSGRSTEDLAREATQRSHQRSEDFKDHFEYITVVALYAMGIAILLLASTWIYHLLMPSSWHWLHNDQLTKIQNIFTGGVLAGLIAEQFQKRMN